MSGRSPATKALGSALRQTRSEHNLSQEALALEAGLHRNLIGAIERGEVSPSYDTIVKIAQALEIKASQLIALAEQNSASKTQL